MKLRYIISRILLILMGMGLALSFFEIILRILPIPNRFALMQRLEQQWESDDELLLRLKPNMNMRIYGHPEFSYTVHTNSDGLRDEPFVGDFTIAAIGDSFTFGFGVEEHESWPSQLEILSDTRVANLGWAGWNSYVYPVAIKRYAIPLKTRIWLWAFFINDLPESAGAQAFFSSGETDYIHWARENHLLSTDLPFLLRLRTIQLLAAVFNPELFLLPNSGDRVFDNGELRMRVGDYSWQVTDPNNAEVQRGWELTEEALLEAKELAMVHNASLVVIFIPSREHVYWPHIEDVLRDVDIQQLDNAEAKLAAFCQTHNIAYLNLLPGFRSRANKNELLYFPADGHWNVAGHELAAELIHEFLLDAGFIGP